MPFEQGTVHCKSSKDKLNTKSSMESDLVGNIYHVPFNAWMVILVEAQGCTD